MVSAPAQQDLSSTLERERARKANVRKRRRRFAAGEVRSQCDHKVELGTYHMLRGGTHWEQAAAVLGQGCTHASGLSTHSLIPTSPQGARRAVLV